MRHLCAQLRACFVSLFYGLISLMEQYRLVRVGESVTDLAQAS